MTKTSKTIVFFGTEDFSAIALKRLLKHHKVSLVVTKPDSVKGRGRKITPPLVKEIALENDIKVLQPRNSNEMKTGIEPLQDPLGVLVSYGKIIPQSILDLFPDGIVNIHPSLLPRYRGPSPIESTIANGDKEGGVSLMYLIDKMDAGPVIEQTSINLNGTETQSSLYANLAELGSDLLLSFLEDYNAGRASSPIPQTEELATYTSLLSKDMTRVNPATMTADDIERKVRAHHLYPKTSLPVLGEYRITTEVHATQTPSETSIECLDNTWLEVDKLISPSGKTITLRDLLNSLSNRK